MATALAITDTHIGLNFPDDRIEQALWSFLDIVEEVKPNVIFHLGDVFNVKKPDGRQVEFASQWFLRMADMCDGIFVLAGGHDQDAHADITAIDYLDDISPKIEVFNELKVIESICMLPYTRKLTKSHQVAMEEASTILMHQGIDEAPLDHGKRKYGGMKDAVPLEWVENSALTVCGHIHTPWQNSQGNVVVLGSPFQTLYRHPLCERYCGYWSLDNPSDFTAIPLENTFYLNRLTIDIEEGEDIEKGLIAKLPPLEENTYYYVLISLEGAHKPAQIKKAKKVVARIYGDALDEIQVVSVLPKGVRTTYDQLRTVSKQAVNKTPEELLNMWMDLKGATYYKAHPQLKNAIIQEFQDIKAMTDAHIK